MFQDQWAFAECLQEIPKLKVFFLFLFLFLSLYSNVVYIYSHLTHSNLPNMHFSFWNIGVLHFVANKSHYVQNFFITKDTHTPVNSSVIFKFLLTECGFPEVSANGILPMWLVIIRVIFSPMSGGKEIWRWGLEGKHSGVDSII